MSRTGSKENSIITTVVVKKKGGESVFAQCTGCHEPVTKQDSLENNAVLVMGKIWHRAHVVCIRCKAPTAAAYHQAKCEPGQVICPECHMKAINPHCSACDSHVTESYLEAAGKKWHHDCFRCKKCHGPIVDQYGVLNGQVYDADCYSTICNKVKNLSVCSSETEF